MSTARTSRSRTELWLIGHASCDPLSGNKLPSIGEVLRRFAQFHKEEKQTLGDAASSVIAEVEPFWAKARIPTMTSKSAARKLLAVYNKWQTLQRSRKRSGPTAEAARLEFTDSLGDLFDVAHDNALALTVFQEDRDFLLAQRERGRRGRMAGIDKTLSDVEQRSFEREAAEERRRQREKQRAEEAMQEATQVSSSSSPSPPVSRDEHALSLRKRKSRKRNIVTPELASTLDRTKTSNREASLLVQAVASSLGQESNELSLSRETIRRSRLRHRAEIANELKMTFDPRVPLIVHWDGKVVPDFSGEKVERIAILVSGDGVDKLLAVPKLPDGTGRAQANAVLDALADWDLNDRVAGLSFDTTASNTGVSSGACVLIEQGLHRQLLNLACRHHMMELVAEKAFTECLGPSSGPDIPLFSRLKERWPYICTDQFCPIANEDLNKPLLESRDDLIACFQRHINNGQPRDDYRELLELGIIALGGIPQRGVRFMRPGAIHRARWMAKIIYTIKIHLFRDQIHLTAQEDRGVLRFVNFALLMYISAWFTAPLPAAAPRSDLAMLQALVKYGQVDMGVSRVTSTVFRRHLWYLSEHLAALAIFDDHVPLEVKKRMVTAIEKAKGTEQPPRRIVLDLSAEELEQKTVADFCTTSSKVLFERLAIDTSFLDSDPATWSSSTCYMEGKRRVMTLSTVNDHAERGIALMQQFNLALTKDEEQRQYLLQVVESHRKEHPSTSTGNTRAHHAP